MTLKELDKLSRADKILEAFQANMSEALPAWRRRFAEHRIDTVPWESLRVLLLKAVDSMCQLELRPCAEFAQSGSRDEFISDIRRLVAPLVAFELTRLVDEEEKSELLCMFGPFSPEIHGRSLSGGVFENLTNDVTSLIESRALEMFERASFRVHGPEAIDNLRERK